MGTTTTDPIDLTQSVAGEEDPGASMDVALTPPPEAPATGANACPKCGGKGRLQTFQCPECGGTGKAAAAKGGA